ncbi:MAG: DUF502 domain-containing protein [bacterium]|nr:DUF502 domain-containing protein [bacterium]
MTEEDMNKQENDINSAPEKSKTNIFIRNARNDFLYGLFVILPSIATIGILIFMIDLISGPVSVLFGQKIPTIASFFITLVFITTIGMAARNILGKALLSYFENIMNKIPIINTVYKSTKQILTAFSFKKKGLLSAVLVEYPRKGTWALGFITKEQVSGLIDIYGKDHSKDKCSLFVPTTPNPTSGYYIYVDKKDIIKLALSIEESVKVLMSAGVVAPDSNNVPLENQK